MNGWNQMQHRVRLANDADVRYLAQRLENGRIVQHGQNHQTQVRKSSGYVAKQIQAISVLTCRHGEIRHKHVKARSEEHTSELQSQSNLVCRLLLEKKKKTKTTTRPPPQSKRDDDA